MISRKKKHTQAEIGARVWATRDQARQSGRWPLDSPRGWPGSTLLLQRVAFVGVSATSRASGAASGVGRCGQPGSEVLARLGEPTLRALLGAHRWDRDDFTLVLGYDREGGCGESVARRATGHRANWTRR